MLHSFQPIYSLQLRHIHYYHVIHQRFVKWGKLQWIKIFLFYLFIFLSFCISLLYCRYCCAYVYTIHETFPCKRTEKKRRISTKHHFIRFYMIFFFLCFSRSYLLNQKFNIILFFFCSFCIISYSFMSLCANVQINLSVSYANAYGFFLLLLSFSSLMVCIPYCCFPFAHQFTTTESDSVGWRG